MHDLFDLNELREIQDKFCALSDVFVCCFDENGKRISSLVGNPADVEILNRVLDEDQMFRIFERATGSSLEDQIVEETIYKNLKIASIVYKMNGKPMICWLVCYVLEDYIEKEGELFLEGIQTKTTEERLDKCLDFLRVVAGELFQAKYYLREEQEKTRRTRYSATELEKNLKRAETLTETVQLLGSDQPFEMVAARMLEITGRYLNVSSMQLFQIGKDETKADVIAEWLNTGIASVFDRTKGIERSGVIKSEKPLIISKDTIVSRETKAALERVHVKAFIAMPLIVNNKVVMYWCFCECRNERVWSLEDIHFINDVTKVLQSILAKRIQKNSLASSFASLQAILDNVGSAIYVKDAQTDQLLFANKNLKQNFMKELKEGRLEDVLNNAEHLGKNGYFEVNYPDRKRWYDLHVNQIKWVDGREVSLCSLFDITDKKLYQKKIEQQAYTDFLTGLYNRMCCERDLACEVDKARQNQAKGALLYLDLDDFKHINDGLGHQYGDVLLKAISGSLSRIEGIESSCYRMGGDEFVIIIPMTSYGEYERIIGQIKDIFSKPWFLKDADYYCTMSMGIVIFPDDGNSVQELIKKADLAMYEAKKAGKNRCTYYSEQLSSASNKRLDLEKNMRDATATGYKEFEVYYQPIVDISKGNVCTGAEALIRWNSVSLGFIPPSDFIPLAEYLGLINPIGNHVLKEACAACKKWNDSGRGTYKVNVNLSVVQLLQTDIVDIIKNTIESTQIAPQNLTLEVTESLAINDIERMKGIINRIRSLGVRIALDDFGTGYSSLNHIREIPLDVIKVDQNFVKDLAEDNYSRSFIRMVGELADAIDVNVCVEGIETKKQLDALNGMQVQLVQGYYFDKPLKQEEFEKKYVLTQNA